MKSRPVAYTVIAIALLALVAIVVKGYLKPVASPTPSPIGSATPANQVTWDEGKKLITGCRVQQSTELHNGSLRLDLTDGTDRSISPYNQDELYQLVQSVPAKCKFSIVVATE